MHWVYFSIPSVLIDFGIAVLGGLVSVIADERLNSLTAGFLPLDDGSDIFTWPKIHWIMYPSLRTLHLVRLVGKLVPGNFPSAITGIISAVLLGFGRVIGETMVVLLWSRNRIAILDFTSGLGVFAQLEPHYDKVLLPVRWGRLSLKHSLPGTFYGGNRTILNFPIVNYLSQSMRAIQGKLLIRWSQIR